MDGARFKVVVLDLAILSDSRGLNSGICFFLNGIISIIPAANPPICAHHAVPFSLPKLRNCIPIQNPKTMIAGRRSGIIFINKTSTRAFGWIIKYAPRTPEIAPLAPIKGEFEPYSTMACVRVANIPQIK